MVMGVAAVTAAGACTAGPPGATRGLPMADSGPQQDVGEANRYRYSDYSDANWLRLAVYQYVLSFFLVRTAASVTSAAPLDMSGQGAGCGGGAWC